MGRAAIGNDRTSPSAPDADGYGTPHFAKISDAAGASSLETTMTGPVTVVLTCA